MTTGKLVIAAIVVVLVGTAFIDGCASKPAVITTEVRGSQDQSPAANPRLKKMSMEEAVAKQFEQANKNMTEQVDALAKQIMEINRNLTAQGDALAQQIARSNENTMRQIEELHAAQANSWDTAQQALERLEEMSRRHGGGQVTLFFNRGSAVFDRFQYQRLVNFLDYLGRESHGREIILVSVGSCSANGRTKVNKKLSMKRSEAPLPVIKHFLVNVPYKFYDVAGIGSFKAPKKASAQEHKRHQSVRLIAVYEKSHIPTIPGV